MEVSVFENSLLKAQRITVRMFRHKISFLDLFLNPMGNTTISLVLFYSCQLTNHASSHRQHPDVNVIFTLHQRGVHFSFL